MSAEPVAWPTSLIDEVASRRAVFVLGAGVSADSVGVSGVQPPTWPALIGELSGKVTGGADRELLSKLVEAKQYLDAAQIIRDQIAPADFSEIIKSKFELPNYAASEIHKIIYAIDPKVVVTTNYDRIYEKYCDSAGGRLGHNVCKYYETHALNDLRSNTRSILKIHGCTSDPSRVVLDRNSYFSARRDYPHFFRVLDSLFLTCTLVFIGTSLDDPDLQLLLQNANVAAPCAHSHFALMLAGQHPSKLRSLSKNYNINVIEYYDPSHKDAVDRMKELSELALIRRGSM